MLELLSSRRVESLKHVYESEIDILIKDLMLYINGKNKVKVVISEWMEKLTFNIITKMIGGKRIYAYDISGEFVPSDLIPILGWFGFQGQVLKSMKKVSRDLDKLVGSWIEEHEVVGVNKSNDKQDFIDVMLSVIDDDPASGHNRDTIIKANITMLMLAGSDTIFTTMTWTLALLLNNKNKASSRLKRKLIIT
ncbi:cytochrome P450 CYP82D47 [Trifolium repens]|nr:cytochrome P450 CYP82D47 [Trifolium repens]